MNAREIVDLLLENDANAGERTGVYIFGPDLPREGYNAADLPQAFADFEQTEVIPKGSGSRSGLMDQLVRAGYTFFIKKAPGDIEVIGKIPAHTTPEGQERAAQFLGLDRHHSVQYRLTPTGTSKQMNVDAVLFGSKAMEKPKPGAPKKPAEQPGLPDVNTGYADRGEIMPLNAPLDLGITIDLDSKEGVIIREVHPGGPAAQAGIEAGAVIISTGKFAKADGSEPQSYWVQTPKHLEFVLRTADSQYPIPFRIVQGDGDEYVPIMPRQKKQSAPDTEERAVGRGATRDAAADDLVAKVRTKKQQPNAVAPTHQTGHAPANVSTLT